MPTCEYKLSPSPLLRILLQQLHPHPSPPSPPPPSPTHTPLICLIYNIVLAGYNCPFNPSTPIFNIFRRNVMKF